ncbi:hypothetical protein I350_06055 [Cryptococcus amylolentus CBS 6273]|uniref:Uncharacterized protein n=1 Tax=Cryptococcus amylolentus CBS 6273 TaxID=1296118 RepID=A0A1E3JQR4_9TREE|nr:hypothetical protein I350_06055 [Cryptococcus amylolentus CBS 6273]
MSNKLFSFILGDPNEVDIEYPASLYAKDPTKLPQLSPELWAHVLSFCLEPPSFQYDDYQSQSTLATCLRVNTTFYIAAAPILYRSPGFYDIGNFLLGADNPVPAALASQTPGVDKDMMYLKHGNTKLPLLRHVRRITPLAWEIDMRDTAEIIADQTRSIELANTILQPIIRHQPRPPVENSPFFPHLSQIAIDPSFRGGSLGKQTEIIRTEFSDDFTTLHKSLLLSGPLPKAVCCTDHPSVPVLRALDWVDREKGTLPRVVTIHTELKEAFDIMFGVTTRIYVDYSEHENPETFDFLPPEGGALLPRDAVIDFFMEMLEDSSPAFGSTITEHWEGVVENTVIEVYGLENIVDWEEDEDESDSDEDYSDESDGSDGIDEYSAIREELDRKEGNGLNPKELRNPFGASVSESNLRRKYLRKFQEELLEIMGDVAGHMYLPKLRLKLGTDAPPCEACGRGPLPGPPRATSGAKEGSEGEWTDID